MKVLEPLTTLLPRPRLKQLIYLDTLSCVSSRTSETGLLSYFSIVAREQMICFQKRKGSPMSINTLKQGGLAILAVATISASTMMLSTTASQAAGLMPAAPIAGSQTATVDNVVEVGGRRIHRRWHRGHRHGRRWHRGRRHHARWYGHGYADCIIKRKRVWSNYYHEYIWKKVRICY